MMSVNFVTEVRPTVAWNPELAGQIVAAPPHRLPKTLGAFFSSARLPTSTPSSLATAVRRDFLSSQTRLFSSMKRATDRVGLNQLSRCNVATHCSS
jgi:hypothetical protein